MRRLLDALYLVSGVAGAVCLAAIGVLVLAQTAGRLVGVVVPSANELAGFCVAASAFLALAHTLNHGGHIRVRVVLEHLGGCAGRAVEAAALVVALAMSAYASWWAVDLVRGSIRYGDVSPGLLAVPLWIPQTGMAAGLVVFTIALADNLLRVLRGRPPLYAVED
ncbi:TRAP transporter small permease [Arhodomonas aquaeolei]|uniref:TRAP transporter small permease n=1 Tax=Arhodomonas aquaeolei TaxID=2369 RepID=UPI0003776730|nr:TRAP transporter small permease [Arhodomonas aquaeolei]MCS4504885.1 TRAP transporter small permease [Arhodomonas aquaeolei]